jgi:ABC-type antimicrobial peptide transport system permease subunit
MTVIIAAMFAAGLVGTALAVWAAARMQLAEALRGE